MQSESRTNDLLGLTSSLSAGSDEELILHLMCPTSGGLMRPEPSPPYQQVMFVLASPTTSTERPFHYRRLGSRHRRKTQRPSS